MGNALYTVYPSTTTDMSSSLLKYLSRTMVVERKRGFYTNPVRMAWNVQPK